RGARKPYPEEERDAARAKLVVLLDKMEEALKPSGWLVGKAYSIPDIAAAPLVKSIDEEPVSGERGAHRRGDCAGRSQRKETYPRPRMVDKAEGAAGLCPRRFRPLHRLLKPDWNPPDARRCQNRRKIPCRWQDP